MPHACVTHERVTVASRTSTATDLLEFSTHIARLIHAPSRQHEIKCHLAPWALQLVASFYQLITKVSGAHRACTGHRQVSFPCPSGSAPGGHKGGGVPLKRPSPSSFQAPRRDFHGLSDAELPQRRLKAYGDPLKIIQICICTCHAGLFEHVLHRPQIFPPTQRQVHQALRAKNLSCTGQRRRGVRGIRRSTSVIAGRERCLLAFVVAVWGEHKLHAAGR